MRYKVKFQYYKWRYFEAKDINDLKEKVLLGEGGIGKMEEGLGYADDVSIEVEEVT